MNLNSTLNTTGNITCSSSINSVSYQSTSTTLNIGTTTASYSSANRGVLEVYGTNTSIMALKTSGGVNSYLYMDGTNLTLLSGGTGSLSFHANGSQQANITGAGLFQFNSGYGSVAPAYGCRVWLSYNMNTQTIIASGGVTNLEDIRLLKGQKGILGAITGRAIYEGSLNLREAQLLLDEQHI